MTAARAGAGCDSPVSHLFFSSSLAVSAWMWEANGQNVEAESAKMWLLLKPGSSCSSCRSRPRARL